MRGRTTFVVFFSHRLRPAITFGVDGLFRRYSCELSFSLFSAVDGESRHSNAGARAGGDSGSAIVMG